MVNERRNKEIQGRNIFMYEMESQIQKNQLFVDSFETLMSRYTKKKTPKLRNIYSIYQKNILSLAERLQVQNINYFGNEFYLRRQYEKHLNDILSEIDKKETAFASKTVQIGFFEESIKGKMLIRALKLTSFFDMYFEESLKEIMKLYEKLEKFSLENNLEELLIDKYNDEDGICKSDDAYSILYYLDGIQLYKLGLWHEFRKISPKIVEIINEKSPKKEKNKQKEKIN